MSATYQHTDALGGTATSIIDSVNIYDMVHMVQPNRTGDNGDPAFLVDSSPNTTDLPDTLYLADGTTAPVKRRVEPSGQRTVSTSNLDVRVTCNETSGWDYLQMPDPGDGFTLVKVVRSDGTQILVGPDAWTTHPVDAGTDDPVPTCCTSWTSTAPVPTRFTTCPSAPFRRLPSRCPRFLPIRPAARWRRST